MTDDICIMEKGIPRDAGRLPEYAMSILVCIDEISNGIAWGHIWLFCMEKPITFNGLGNLLLLIDLILDKMGQPARWFELRTIMPGKMKDSECEDVYQTPVYTPEKLKCMHGKIGTATVRIYARQNATIQGELRFMGKVNRVINFRSALELLHMMQEWLELRNIEVTKHD